jgi:hypothetical protein
MPFTPDWQRLLPHESYRFHLGLRLGDAPRFFASTTDHDRILAERVRYLDAAHADHCRLELEGESLLEETLHFAAAWASLALAAAESEVEMLPESNWLARCGHLGQSWEPDFLLLMPDSHGVFRLRGGVVCFPSSWSLEEKMGRTVAEIHNVVPTLNHSLSRQIDAFLHRIAPGAAWERANWGLSNGSNLNRHPKLNLPHQVLFRLPRTLGLLFGIRLSLHPLLELRENLAAAIGLRMALETMPEDIARYKGVHQVRGRLVQALTR